MFDTIAEIIPDSLSLYLKKEVHVEIPDTTHTGFSLFEIIPTGKNKVLFDTISSGIENEKIFNGFSGLPLPGFYFQDTIFFILFLFCLIGLSYWSNKGGSYFVANLKRFFVSDSSQRTTYKEQVTTSGVWSMVFMVFQTILFVTMILFVILERTNSFAHLTISRILIFTVLYFGLLLLVLMKYMVYRLTDYVFPEWGFSSWNEQFFSLVGVVGLMIFVPTLFYLFAPEFSKEMIFLLLIVFFIIQIVIFRKLLVIFVKNKIGLLNYFLYLCAIEIVPLFLIYKGASMLI